MDFTTSIKSFDQKAEEIAVRMREITDKAVAEKRGLTEAEEREHEQLAEAYDSIPSKIAREFMVAPGAAPVSRDTEGRPFRYIERDQKFTDLVPREEREKWQGTDLGKICRALATGNSDEITRRALSEGTPSAGGYTVPTPLSSQLIDRMRSRSVVLRAGARVVDMQSETLKFAKLLTDPTAAWRNEAAPISDSSPSFGVVTLTARSLASLVKVSWELLEDTVNASEALMNAFSQSMSLEVDRVALEGSGVAPEPEGLLNITNVNEVDAGGSTLGYGDIYTGLEGVYSDNFDQPTAIITHPRDYADVMRLTNNDSNWYAPAPWAGLSDFRNLSNDGQVPAWLTTTGISATRANTNTSPDSANGSTAYLGDFRQLLWGVRSTLQIRRLDELYAENGQVGFIAVLRADIQVAHPEAFARIIDIAS